MNIATNDLMKKQTIYITPFVVYKDNVFFKALTCLMYIFHTMLK